MQIKTHELGVTAISESRTSYTNTNVERPVTGSSPLDENSTATLSSLAQRLSAAAELAAVRDSQLSRKELTVLAALIREKIYGASYEFSKSTHDAEAPKNDPKWLASARQATDFLNGRADNPFFGMSSLQLSVIAYDEGGSFTVNERQAAMVETGRQYSEWSRSICQQMWDEYQLTGKSTEGLKGVLAYYKDLPAIEESRYGSYEVDILLELSLQEVEWPEFNTSLLDMMANEWKPAAEREAEASDANATNGPEHEGSAS